MYSFKRAVIEMPIFTNIMPFKIFRQISRLLHFSNNKTAETKNLQKFAHPINIS